MKYLNILIVSASLMSGSPFYSQTTKSAQQAERNELIEVNDSTEGVYGNLDELVVTAKKEVIKSDGAKLTYDLEQDNTSKGSSVLDALRKVPMVSVDGQDNIRIKGDTNFKIYINGKEEPMLSANASQILKAMPAESVSKIEVITEPGAKYDAEGTGGILNLITERKQRKDGYAGSISANLSTQNKGGSLYGRMKYDKVTADANFNYSDNLWSGNNSINEQETINHNSDINYKNLVSIRQAFDFRYYGGGLNLSWEPSDKDLFSISGNIYNVNASIDKLDIYNQLFDRSNKLLTTNTQSGLGYMRNLGASGNASYKRNLSENGQNLIAAYAFNYGKQAFHLGYNKENQLEKLSSESVEKNNNDTYNREHTATIDYTNPFGNGKHTVEAGVKGVFRRNTADSKKYSGHTWEDLLYDANNSVVTNQIQDVYAVYASYSGVFDKISLKAGIRYEHTHTGMDFILGEGENYRRELDDVAPNAAVTYMFGPASNLRLAYQMRISRPNLEQMNPFQFEMYQGEIKIGNPNLESERYNNLTLTYSNYGRTLGGNISIEGFVSDNTIEEFNYYENNIRYTTWGNLGNKKRIALAGFLNWNVTNSLTFNINGSVNYTSIKSGKTKLRNQGWNGNYGATIAYTGPWDVKYSLYGGQSTGEISLQGKWCGWYYYGLGISKSFLKDDAMTISLNASNFLTKYTHYKGYTHTDTHSMHFTGKNRSWNVGVSISWNFGHLQDQVKKTDANIKNDDTKSSGSAKGGIGM